MATRIHITSADAPIGTVKRKLGAVNVGIYCGKCHEFIAFAVEPAAMKEALEFTSDQPILVRCPMCGYEEHRHVAEIRRLPLKGGNKRKRV